MSDETESAFKALAEAFDLFRCERLFVLKPYPDADGCYPALATIERNVIVPPVGSFCSKHRMFKYAGSSHDCPPGITEYYREICTRWFSGGKWYNVVAFAYFCDRRAHKYADAAADTAYAAADAADAAARAAARAADAAARAAAHAADAADAAARAVDAADAEYRAQLAFIKLLEGDQI